MSSLTAASPWRVATLVRLPRSGAMLRSFSTTHIRSASWGFIGLGQMGFPMAKNLRASLPPTDTMVIFDANPAATERFVKDIGTTPASGAGAAREESSIQIAENVREVAEKAETIITVLPEPSHVKSVFQSILHPQLPAAAEQTRLFIDCSTIDPASSREVANAVHSTNQGKFVDAPMSGGVVGARAGTLTFMLGAPLSLVDRVNPILSMMGKRIFHLGEQSAGLSGKLANNYLLAINNIATAEAMNLGVKWGLDPKVLGAMINACTGRCWPSEVNNPVPGVVEGAPASRDYAGGFGLSLMKKDLGLAMNAAEEANARLELAKRAHEVYEAVEQDEACKGKDFSVVYKYLGGTA